MPLYILEFSSVKSLHQFIDTLGGTYTEINLRTITVVCECSEEHVEIATTGFNAKVVEVKE